MSRIQELMKWKDRDGDEAELSTTNDEYAEDPLVLTLRHNADNDEDDSAIVSVYLTPTEALDLIEALKPYAAAAVPPTDPEEIDQWLST